MNKDKNDECCPKFNPEPWDEKEFTWEKRFFVKDRVTSIFHIPLNFGSVLKRNLDIIEAANALPETMLVLADENSLWGSDMYIEVSKEIAALKMASISGNFISKVFEGPYRDMQKWIKEMESFVQGKDKQIKKMYFYYTTCPKCAKKHGKNYVVILAQI